MIISQLLCAAPVVLFSLGIAWLVWEVKHAPLVDEQENRI
jgi:hypothetical protein